METNKLLTTSLSSQAISLDFLGVPGSALGCATTELIAKHGFPAGKRLGAGVVDGRSVWGDGDAPAAQLGALVKQARAFAETLDHHLRPQFHHNQSHRLLW